MLRIPKNGRWVVLHVKEKRKKRKEKKVKKMKSIFLSSLGQVFKFSLSKNVEIWDFQTNKTSHDNFHPILSCFLPNYTGNVGDEGLTD